MIPLQILELDAVTPDVCIDEDRSIRNAAECINRNLRGIVVVVDRGGFLIDTITDGDIRRAVLEGVDLDAPLSDLRARRNASPYPTPVTAPTTASSGQLLELMRTHNI